MGVEIWYIAAKFESEKQAGAVYFPLQEWLRRKRGNASVARLMLHGVWHVIALGYGADDDGLAVGIQERINGSITDVPHNLLETLLVRREARSQNAQPNEQGDVWTEAHQPTLFERLPQPLHHAGITFVNKAKPTFQTVAYREDLKKKPFIIAYGKHSMDLYVYEFQRLLKTSGEELYGVSFITEAVTRVNASKLKRSRKYLFTPSALDLHRSIMDLYPPTEVAQRSTHVWIECETPQENLYGKMRAMFFYNAFPLEDIHILFASAPEYPDIVRTYSVHSGKWGLEIIDEEYNAVFDFTYDIPSDQWVFLNSHICPTGKCIYPHADDAGEFLMAHATLFCQPCDYCLKACRYYATWLFTALAMIDGEYALSPDDPEFEQIAKQYMETRRKKVGKGKNQHVINVDEKREVEYTLVTYEVTKPKRRLSAEEQQAVDSARRTSWLATTPAGEIIWQKRRIKTHPRRYPTRKDGTRQQGAVQVSPFVKRVPLLREPKRTVITKVVANTANN
jgi:hypothetical protein